MRHTRIPLIVFLIFISLSSLLRHVSSQVNSQSEIEPFVECVRTLSDTAPPVCRAYFGYRLQQEDSIGSNDAPIPFKKGPLNSIILMSSSRAEKSQDIITVSPIDSPPEQFPYGEFSSSFYVNLPCDRVKDLSWRIGHNSAYAAFPENQICKQRMDLEEESEEDKQKRVIRGTEEIEEDNDDHMNNDADDDFDVNDNNGGDRNFHDDDDDDNDDGGEEDDDGDDNDDDNIGNDSTPSRSPIRNRTPSVSVPGYSTTSLKPRKSKDIGGDDNWDNDDGGDDDGGDDGGDDDGGGDDGGDDNGGDDNGDDDDDEYGGKSKIPRVSMSPTATVSRSKSTSSSTSKASSPSVISSQSPSKSATASYPASISVSPSLSVSLTTSMSSSTTASASISSTASLSNDPSISESSAYSISLSSDPSVSLSSSSSASVSSEPSMTKTATPSLSTNEASDIPLSSCSPVPPPSSMVPDDVTISPSSDISTSSSSAPDSSTPSYSSPPSSDASATTSASAEPSLSAESSYTPSRTTSIPPTSPTSSIIEIPQSESNSIVPDPPTSSTSPQIEEVESVSLSMSSSSDASVTPSSSNEIDSVQPSLSASISRSMELEDEKETPSCKRSNHPRASRSEHPSRSEDAHKTKSPKKTPESHSERPTKSPEPIQESCSEHPSKSEEIVTKSPKMTREARSEHPIKSHHVYPSKTKETEEEPTKSPKITREARSEHPIKSHHIYPSKTKETEEESTKSPKMTHEARSEHPIKSHHVYPSKTKETEEEPTKSPKMTREARSEHPIKSHHIYPSKTKETEEEPTKSPKMTHEARSEHPIKSHPAHPSKTKEVEEEPTKSPKNQRSPCSPSPLPESVSVSVSKSQNQIQSELPTELVSKTAAASTEMINTATIELPPSEEPSKTLSPSSSSASQTTITHEATSIAISESKSAIISPSSSSSIIESSHTKNPHPTKSLPRPSSSKHHHHHHHDHHHDHGNDHDGDCDSFYGDADVDHTEKFEVHSLNEGGSFKFWFESTRIQNATLVLSFEPYHAPCGISKRGNCDNILPWTGVSDPIRVSEYCPVVMSWHPERESNHFWSIVVKNETHVRYEATVSVEDLYQCHGFDGIPSKLFSRSQVGSHVTYEGRLYATWVKPRSCEMPYECEVVSFASSYEIQIRVNIGGIATVEYEKSSLIIDAKWVGASYLNDGSLAVEIETCTRDSAHFEINPYAAILKHAQLSQGQTGQAMQLKYSESECLDPSRSSMNPNRRPRDGYCCQRWTMVIRSSVPDLRDEDSVETGTVKGSKSIVFDVYVEGVERAPAVVLVNLGVTKQTPGSSFESRIHAKLALYRDRDFTKRYSTDPKEKDDDSEREFESIDDSSSSLRLNHKRDENDVTPMAHREQWINRYKGNEDDKKKWYFVDCDRIYALVRSEELGASFELDIERVRVCYARDGKVEPLDNQHPEITGCETPHVDMARLVVMDGFGNYRPDVYDYVAHSDPPNGHYVKGFSFIAKALAPTNHELFLEIKWRLRARNSEVAKTVGLGRGGGDADSSALSFFSSSELFGDTDTRLAYGREDHVFYVACPSDTHYDIDMSACVNRVEIYVRWERINVAVIVLVFLITLFLLCFCCAACGICANKTIVNTTTTTTRNTNMVYAVNTRPPGQDNLLGSVNTHGNDSTSRFAPKILYYPNKQQQQQQQQQQSPSPPPSSSLPSPPISAYTSSSPLSVVPSYRQGNLPTRTHSTTMPADALAYLNTKKFMQRGSGKKIE